MLSKGEERGWARLAGTMFALLGPIREPFSPTFCLLLGHWVLGKWSSLLLAVLADIRVSSLGTQEAGMLAKSRKGRLCHLLARLCRPNRS